MVVIQMIGVQGAGKTTLATQLANPNRGLFNKPVRFIQSPIRDFFESKGLNEKSMAQLDVSERKEIQEACLHHSAKYYTEEIQKTKRESVLIMDRCGEAFAAYTAYYSGEEQNMLKMLKHAEEFPPATVMIELPSPTWPIEDGYRNADQVKENTIFDLTKILAISRSKDSPRFWFRVPPRVDYFTYLDPWLYFI